MAVIYPTGYKRSCACTPLGLERVVDFNVAGHHFVSFVELSSFQWCFHFPGLLSTLNILGQIARVLQLSTMGNGIRAYLLRLGII